MVSEIDHDVLNDALRRCGANWNAAQTHGALAGRLAIDGAAGASGWLSIVLEGADEANALRGECEAMLATLFQSTHQKFEERLSRFALLLPDDVDSSQVRTEALAHWCEGYLHGLVAGEHSEALKKRLAGEPLSDIIKDMLQITRAVTEQDDDSEEEQEAYAEIVEYLRVAAQLVYEELAELRPGQA